MLLYTETEKFMNRLIAYHDSHDVKYRSPFGAVPCGQQVQLKIRIQSPSPIEEAILRIWWSERGEEKIAMTQVEGDKGLYQAFVTPSQYQLLWYYFTINYKGQIFYYTRPNDRYGGIGQLDNHPVHSYQITVYKEGYKVPKWYREGVMYQIFPDRFYKGAPATSANPEKINSETIKYSYHHEHWEGTPFYKPDPITGEIENNDFFGGNLEGIIAKLDYLKDLGVTIIYLNPIFEAHSNHRYNVGDYMKVDPMLGDLSTFRKLCSEAKERGMSIILDGVFSHSGSDSVYFNKEENYPSIGAYQSKDSPYYSWYRFNEFPDDYDCWWDVKTLPNINELEPYYMDFIIHDEDSVVKYWIKQGARGWRLDVADELPGVFIKELRHALKCVNPDAVLIGEVWEDATNKVSYGSLREYLLGEELDAAMNYPFKDMVYNFLLEHGNGEHFHRASMTLYENYPKEAFFGAMNLLGTHDVIRLRTILGEAPAEDSLTRDQQSTYKMTEKQKSLATKRQKLATLLQMTFPGVPAIYYGDEAGMEGYRDPFNRGTYPWGNEDLSMVDWYKKLIMLRNKMDALRSGDYIPIVYQGGVYGFIRQIEKNTDVFGEYAENGLVLILINRDREQTHNIGIDLTSYSIKNLKNALDESNDFKFDNGYLTINLKPLTGVMLVSDDCNKKGASTT